MQNSIITTFSGLIGGTTKALASGFTLMSITFYQLATVAIYAAVSALVGYFVKYLIDSIRNKRKRRRYYR